MILEVVLSTHQQRYIPEAGNKLAFSEAITVAEVMRRWQIPDEEISVALLDGVRIDFDTAIQSDGVLRLFPGIIGG